MVPRITAVSYLNTIPFIYGIEHEGAFRCTLKLAPPALCAADFAAGEADIALVPVAAVPTLSDARIITDYCIGASGPVRSVVIMSDSPVGEVRRIWLDPHSLTSVQLSGFLAARRWKIAPEWLALEDYETVRHAQPGDAFLLIGDKVFDHEGLFRYTYDLADEWRAATGLPFAFAVWVARKEVPFEVTDALQQALTFGVEHVYEAILRYGYDDRPYAYEYLTRNIDFLFDGQKHAALQQFWNAGIKVAPRVNPG